MTHLHESHGIATWDFGLAAATTQVTVPGGSVIGWPAFTWLTATTIALIALSVSIKTYRRRYAEQMRASVYRSSRPCKIAWTSKHRGKESPETLYLVTEWECILINTSDRAINITSWGVLPPIAEYVVTFAQAFKIKRAVAEMVQAEIIKLHRSVYMVAPDEEIPWPLDIPSGTSKSFKVKIGLPLQRESWEVVQAELNAHRLDDDTQDVFHFADEKKLQIFGDNIGHMLIPVFFRTALGTIFVDVAAFNRSS